MEQRAERAVVIGGSVAGLAAAAALAPHVGEVVVVERRGLPDATAAPASIAPQGGFAHVLLAGGAAALERLSPGFALDLVRQGASVPFEGQGAHWWAAGAVRRRIPDLQVPMPACSRALVESTLRDRVLALANVTAVDGVTVRGIRLDRGAVRGIDAEAGGVALPLDAEVVVDASGRGSSAPAWLEAAGVAPPPVSRVEVGVVYAGLAVRRRPGDLDDAFFAVVQNGRELARIGVALQAEGDRWLVVLGGYFGDAAPLDRPGLLRFAESLPDPAIRTLLDGEWLSEPRHHRFPSSQRRHWEHVRLPIGFAAVGDSVASFNPIYGQGMSAAALQAEAIGRCLARRGVAGIGRPSAKACARVVANPWQVATGADFIYRDTVGPKRRGTDVINRYLERVFVAAAVDDDVHLALARVQNLLAPPSTLVAPGIVRRVRRAGRAAPVVSVERVLQPTSRSNASLT